MDNFVYYPWNSESFFWSCWTLSQDCPFYSESDPKLYYFCVGVVALYCALLAMVLYDLYFYWSIDILQQQMDYYINLVRTKVRQVQTDQRRQTSTKVRAEKLLKVVQESNTVVTALRSALNADDPHYFNILTRKIDDADCQKTGNSNNAKAWGDIAALMEL